MKSTPAQSSPDRVEIISRLRAHGITPTSQRIQISEVLFSKPQHVSAEQVLSMVNRQGQDKVSKATVYNTLGLFAEKGLLHAVIIDPNKVFYDTNLEKHHHLYHTDTGTLEDIAADQVKINQLPKLPEGTVLEDVDVIIRLHKS